MGDADNQVALPALSDGAHYADLPASPTTPAADVQVQVTDRIEPKPDWRTDIAQFRAGHIDRVKPLAPSRKLLSFYKAQTALIEAYAEAEARIQNRLDSERSSVPSGADGARAHAASGDAAASGARSASMKQKQEDSKLLAAAVKFAINASFAGNVALFAIKIFAAAYSGSLAIIGSAIDSSLDLLSGSIIFIATKMAARKNAIKYPVGKSRLEPLSIVVFASVMGTAALQLIVESVQTIAAGVVTPPVIKIDAVAYGVLASVVGVKMCLFLLCYRLSSASDSVEALVTDHRNDVITNSATIAAVVLASYFPVVWWLDAAMAIGLGIMIIAVWTLTGREHIIRLTGHAAENDVLNTLTYIAFNHSPKIRYIDTVRAYYVGSKLLAEVDIVLPEGMPLKEAHDIGESLQKELEDMENVERAFVHLDYEYGHRAEDEHILP